MATILADDNSDAFAWMIWISPKFVPRSPINNKASIGSGDGLALDRQQVITWTNADPVHWCIYVALGGDKFIFTGIF